MKLGISRPVRCRNTTKDRPRFTTSSTKRSDCVSQIKRRETAGRRQQRHQNLAKDIAI